MKKRKLRRWLTDIFLVLLLLLGLVLIFNRSIRNALMAWNANKYQVTKIDKKTLKENDKAGVGEFDYDTVEAVGVEDVIESQLKAQVLPVIGGIAIPDLEINLPIFRGIGNTELMYGAGTMKDDMVMGEGNYALASHSVSGYDSDLALLFTPLANAKNDMMIYITDKETVYQYVIVNIDVVTPEHVEVVDDHPGKKEITLVTCADSQAIRRTIVRGELVKTFKYDKADKTVEAAFNKKYNQFKVF
ncbi:class A sortase [Lactococcus hodotermopsidis]|uniref:Class A sortase n=1 Tax=Pseudolactococcus hodotermopsidis TaxID=2709157 RepID=A0A6A0BB92_9LACT|nr:class A sortase [Lactococcus hodotermopsidis]GFH42719.1 class A sortase [Lactococcus hodotermopsidis]